MTQWNRRIGRQVTNALPAWRTAMTSTNTLYEIGGLPSVAGNEIVWPSAGANNYEMTNGTDNNAYLLHHGYGSGVYVPDLGAHGSIVFGATGEASISHQLTRFTLSADTPAWGMFQQPTYPISSSEAVSMDADLYYSASDYAALPSHRKISTTDAGAFAAGWDDVYPVGYNNWVFRRKLQTSLVGNNIPHFFRYDMPCYIPPAMTGASAGAIVVTSFGTIYGPFSQGVKPVGMTDARWFNDVWPSGNRKHYLWSMNPQTKVWQRLTTPMPDGLSGLNHIKYPHSCVDEANKRIYYWLGVSGGNGLIYADFSSGQASMTWSTPAAMTDLAGGAAPGYQSNAVLCVPQTGALTGKRLWFCRESGASNLLLIDIDNNTLRRVSLTGSPPDSSSFWRMSYDSANNILHITTKESSFGVRNYRITIPDAYTASSYTSTLQQIALNGITLDSTAGFGSTFPHGDRCRYLPALGVILLTQRAASAKMLAFRPA